MTNLYISHKSATRVAEGMRKQGIPCRIYRKTVREADGSLSMGFIVVTKF